MTSSNSSTNDVERDTNLIDVTNFYGRAKKVGSCETEYSMLDDFTGVVTREMNKRNASVNTNTCDIDQSDSTVEVDFSSNIPKTTAASHHMNLTSSFIKNIEARRGINKSLLTNENSRSDIYSCAIKSPSLIVDNQHHCSSNSCLSSTEQLLHNNEDQT
ncbi:unnamed protein product [Rotaria sp. Silwood2]|nr:unnamed protein product [Rotaria sp. Silwood2]CAF3146442.1 unnamed protein product [Rotaria sp. Silwood2]CAF3302582.1 unnamed protein product [Rotaria sp. Silwood2]CAF4502783.1 unnamed protein product [Rotaria sp. Silwood2]CAF4612850.1 unnamed protein product [Rotaria sp. Silwood2]